MKSTFLKKAVAVVAVASLATLGLAGCAGNDASSSSASSAAEAESDNVIRVGATPAPHAEILEQVKGTLADQGYELEIVEYNDYVQPNNALEDGELDANYFQHIAYLDNFNEENGTHLVNAAEIHFEPFGLYAGKTASLDDLADGATIAVPNDTSNEARALLLLEQEGLITLRDGAGLTATVQDIVENPKNLEIKEVEAAQLPRMLQDVDIAAINGNYALDADLNLADALAIEDENANNVDVYTNVVAVKEGNEQSEKTQALIEALTSDTVKQYIESTYNGTVVAQF